MSTKKAIDSIGFLMLDTTCSLANPNGPSEGEPATDVPTTDVPAEKFPVGTEEKDFIETEAGVAALVVLLIALVLVGSALTLFYCIYKRKQQEQSHNKKVQ